MYPLSAEIKKKQCGSSIKKAPSFVENSFSEKKGYTRRRKNDALILLIHLSCTGLCGC